jgi:hypothetical protein
MGIDITALELILLSQRYVKLKNTDILTLGRQQIHISRNDINNSLNKYNFGHLIDKFNYYDYSENLFRQLLNGNSVDSIDNSNYENANIIHNLNLPYNSSKKYQYNFIFNFINFFTNIFQFINTIKK